MADVSVKEPAAFSDELVRRVTDEVYKLLLRDLKRERERMGDTVTRPLHGPTTFRRGVR